MCIQNHLREHTDNNIDHEITPCPQDKPGTLPCYATVILSLGHAPAGEVIALIKTVRIGRVLTRR